MTDPQGAEPAPAHDLSEKLPELKADERTAEAAGPQYPDLVFGVVRTMGTAWDALQQQLEHSLSSSGYKLHPIKLSLHLDQDKSYTNDAERYEALMDAGDVFREKHRSASAVVIRGIEQMRALRRENKDTKNAFLIDKLIHPDEIEVLRGAYGSRLFIIGCDSPRVVRVENMKLRFAQSGMNDDEASQWAVHAVNREAGEGVSKDNHVASLPARYRVAVGKALERADVFTRGDDAKNTRIIIERLVDCIFSEPFHAPTLDELGMALAYQAALTTATLARRVGAAIMLNEQIVAVGSNEVPKYGGGTYHEDNATEGIDGREKQDGKDPSDGFRIDILSDLLAGIQQENLNWSPPPESASKTSRELAVDVANKLPECKALDVIEYTRTTHAEMVAITGAAKLGISIAGATLYTTTFPCHECTSNIIAAGIRRVVYQEPYPKSKGPELHPDSVYVAAHNVESVAKLAFEPFAGFVYWRFHELFSWVPRKKDDLIKKRRREGENLRLQFDGKAVVWKARDAPIRSSIFNPVYAHAEIEKQHIIEEQALKRLQARSSEGPDESQGSRSHSGRNGRGVRSGS